jgi:hypothetical protein
VSPCLRAPSLNPPKRPKSRHAIEKCKTNPPRHTPSLRCETNRPAISTVVLTSPTTVVSPQVARQTLPMRPNAPQPSAPAQNEPSARSLPGSLAAWLLGVPTSPVYRAPARNEPTSPSPNPRCIKMHQDASFLQNAFLHPPALSERSASKRPILTTPHLAPPPATKSYNPLQLFKTLFVRIATRPQTRPLSFSSNRA